MAERPYWPIELQTMEQELRKKFSDNASVSNFQEGYLSIPWANEVLDPKYQRLAAILLAEKLKRHGEVDKIVGVPTLGVPLASLVAVELGVPQAECRKGNVVPAAWTNYIFFDDTITSPTTHEQVRFIFNGLDKGDTVGIVDDILARARTSIYIAKNLHERGINVILGVYCAKFFQEGYGRLQQIGVPVEYIYGVEKIFLDGRIQLAPPDRYGLNHRA